MEEKKQENRIRDKQMKIWVTDIERENYKRKAEYCGLTLSEYFKKLDEEGVIINYQAFDIKALADELNKIGVNINQIAKHINEKGGAYDKNDMKELKEEFENMKALIYGEIWGVNN